MDKQYFYNCPNCGGKAEFRKDIKKWECKYCGKIYDRLYINDNENSHLDDKNHLMYIYKCSSCNKYFLSVASKLDKCLYCGKKMQSNGKEICNNNYIVFDNKRNLSIKQMYEIYLNKLFLVKDYIKDDYLNINFEFKHIFCDIYNGYLLLKHNNIIEKYLFFDLIIPNINYDDYAFAYEITKNVSLTESGYWNYEEEGIPYEALKLEDYEEQNQKDELINVCINKFSKKYKIIDKKEIEIEDNLKNDGYAVLPIYIGKVNDNYQYVKGNQAEEIEPIIRFSKGTEVYNKLLKEKKLYKLFRCFEMISIILTASFFPLGFTASLFKNPDFVYMISVLLIIVFLPLSFICGKIYRKKEKFVELLNYSEHLSKEEYYEKVINEVEFVKIMKVKQ